MALLTALAVLILSAGVAQADRKVYLKGAGGPTEMALTTGGAVRGLGIDISLAAGISLGSSWAFYGEVFNMGTIRGLSSKEITCDDCNVSLSGGLVPGVGAAYYTPGGYNVHLTFHLPKAALTVYDIKLLETARGKAAYFTFGKDWLTQGIGLGYAIKVGMTRIEGLNVGSISLLFTVSRR